LVYFEIGRLKKEGSYLNLATFLLLVIQFSVDELLLCLAGSRWTCSDYRGSVAASIVKIFKGAVISPGNLLDTPEYVHDYCE
jgi:hypothetical protein